MPKPHDVGVGTAVCLVDKNRRMLMLRRKGAHAEGALSWPGGWMDRDDPSLFEAVKRETAEEVGIILRRATQVKAFTSDHPDLGFRSVTVVFLAWQGLDWDEEPQNLEPDKCSELVWVPLQADLDQYRPLFPSIEEAIENIRKHPSVTPASAERVPWTS